MKTGWHIALVLLMLANASPAADLVVEVELMDHTGASPSANPHGKLPARLIFEKSTQARLEIAVPGTEPVQYEPPTHIPSEVSGDVVKAIYDFVTSKEDLAISNGGSISRGQYVQPTSTLGVRYAQYGISSILLIIHSYGPDHNAIAKFFDSEEGIKLYTEMGNAAFAYVRDKAPKHLTMGIYATTVTYGNRMNDDGSLTITTQIGGQRDIYMTPTWATFIESYSVLEPLPLYMSHFSLPAGGTGLDVPFRSMDAQEDLPAKAVLAPEVELLRAAREIRAGNPSATIHVLTLNSMAVNYAERQQFDRARDRQLELEEKLRERGVPTLDPNSKIRNPENESLVTAYTFRRFLDQQPQMTVTAADFKRMGCADLLALP